MFRNPWAWLGLMVLAVPVLVHLLARRPARRIPFPTLRFLPATRLAPISRARLTDAGLLLIRCLAIAAGVAALAQPIWRQRAPDRAADPQVARAILVDASPSMFRDAAVGGTAFEAAQREVAALRGGATSTRVVETRAPAEALAGATSWLASQPMRRELIVVSDFRSGTIEQSDLVAVHAGVGIKLVRIDVRGSLAPSRPDPAAPPAVRLLAGPSGQSGAEAARRAAESRGAPAQGHPDRTVTIVFPDFEQRRELLAAARPLDQPWMFEVVAHTVRNGQADLYLEGLTWSAGATGASELRFFPAVAAGTLASSALVAAAARAASPTPAPDELGATTIADATLRSWERPASDVTPVVGYDPNQFDGRWMWWLALALLALETFVRWSRRSSTSVEVPHERAA